MTTILLSAGDLSGERYAAGLVREIRKRHPNFHFVGMGGEAMAAEGVELVVDQRDLAVGGVIEVASSVGRVVSAWRRMLRCVRERSPDLIVVVDSGGFNLPFAKRARRICGAPVFYYVAPQVWAWREERIGRVADVSDRIAVILPFEKEFYAGHEIEVDYVGHPLLDPALAMDAAARSHRRCAARTRLGIGDGTPLIGLFPASRRSEMKYHLDLFIESFAEVHRSWPELRAVFALAPSLDAEKWRPALDAAAGSLRDRITVVSGDDGDALDAVDLALTKPGTITLELMLRGCPMVVAGRVHPWTARIVRRSLRVGSVSMPNLIDPSVGVRERVQEAAVPSIIASDLLKLRTGEERERLISALGRARSKLGMGGAAARASKIVEALLGLDAA